MRRVRRILIGAMIAFATVFCLAAPSGALAATTSWEWEVTSDLYPGGPVYFGETLAGGGPTEPHEYVLANTGETPITIEHLAIGWESKTEPHVWKIADNGCAIGSTIEPGQTCSVSMVFNPLISGWREGWVRAEAVGGVPAQAKVVLEAHAIGPRVLPEPRSLDFGSVQVGAGPSPAQTITLTDEESLPLHIYGASLADIYDQPETSSPFRVVGGTCQEGLVVTTPGSCTVEVVLEPSRVGSFESKVLIADNAEFEQSVLVRGVGVAPPVVAPPTITTSEPEKHLGSPGQGETAATKGGAGEAPTSPPAVPSTTAPEARPTAACLRDRRKVKDLGKRLMETRSLKQGSTLRRRLKKERAAGAKAC